MALTHSVLPFLGDFTDLAVKMTWGGILARSLHRLFLSPNSRS